MAIEFGGAIPLLSVEHTISCSGLGFVAAYRVSQHTEASGMQLLFFKVLLLMEYPSNSK